MLTFNSNINHDDKKKIVILGAGYGGVLTAQGLSTIIPKLDCEVLLINKHDYHQIITQLHEPAAGHAYADKIRVPLKDLIKDNIKFLKAEVKDIDPDNQLVEINGNRLINYDYLVVALGSDPEYYNVPGMKEYSLPLRSLNAARLIKTHIESCLAKYKVNPADESLLNFVIGGAGFTGVEVAGELAEWLPKVAPTFDVPLEKIRLICVEASSEILPGLDPFISKTTEGVLREKGIELKLASPIKEVTPDYIVIEGETLPTKTLIWTGGVKGHHLVSKAGFTSERGRGVINEYLQSIDYENIFIIGDSSFSRDQEGKPLPPTAQLAIQQGQHLAKNIIRRLKGEELLPFTFDNKGVVASIGRKDAVGLIYGKYRLKGKHGIWMKKLVNTRYLYIIGGIPLVIKKLLGK